MACSLSDKPSFIAFVTTSKIFLIDFEESSFAGIGKLTLLGFELVSTIAKVGIPNFAASDTAMCSFIISTINIAEGILFILEIDPKFFSNFSLVLEICNLSLFDKVDKVPSSSILSIESIFLIDFLIVEKLVNKPPGHLSVI